MFSADHQSKGKKQQEKFFLLRFCLSLSTAATAADNFTIDCINNESPIWNLMRRINSFFINRQARCYFCFANLGAGKLVLFSRVSFVTPLSGRRDKKPSRARRSKSSDRLCCPFIDLFGATTNKSPERGEREKNFFSIESEP